MTSLKSKMWTGWTPRIRQLAHPTTKITKLKIDSNPFAKGFRDSSRLTEFDR
ncbi:T-box transcription factor TBX20 [Biomphalaria glabrata]